MTATKRTKLSKILGYMPSDDQLKDIEALFIDHNARRIIKMIKDYDPEFYLTMHDYLFIKQLKEEVTQCYE